MTELQLWANKRVEEHRAKQRVRVPPKVIARPKSSSDPSITYRVLQYADGRKECSCPGFSYRKRCRHI